MRPRFSLRVFLVLFTLIALAFGGAAHFVYRVKDQVRRHKAAVAKLQEMECKIYETEHGASIASSSTFESFIRRWIDKDYGALSGSCEVGKRLSASETVKVTSFLRDVQGVNSINLAAEELTPEAVRHLAVHSKLKYLFLHVDRIKPNQTWELDDFEKLEHLYLKCPVDDQLATAIGRIPPLHFFDVDASPLSDDGLRALCAGPQLGTISIRHGNITAAPANAIAQSHTIGCIHLTECRITTDTLHQVATAPKLKQMIFDNCDLPPQPIQLLSDCAVLKWLNLKDRQSLNHFDLESLGQLAGLEELSISAPALTNADFERIEPPASLKSFEYEGEIEESLLRKFFTSAPNCEIDQQAPNTISVGYHGKKIHWKDGKIVATEYTYADCGAMPP